MNGEWNGAWENASVGIGGRGKNRRTGHWNRVPVPRTLDDGKKKGKKERGKRMGKKNGEKEWGKRMGKKNGVVEVAFLLKTVRSRVRPPDYL